MSHFGFPLHLWLHDCAYHLHLHKLVIFGFLKQCVKPRIAYFVHGSDGLGETHKAKPKGHKAPISAPDFLVSKAAEFPGEVTVVALGPLTNIALVSTPSKSNKTGTNYKINFGNEKLLWKL